MPAVVEAARRVGAQPPQDPPLCFRVGWDTDTLRVGVRAEILDVPRLALLRLRSSLVFVAERRLDSTTLRRAIDPSMSLSPD